MALIMDQAGGRGAAGVYRARLSRFRADQEAAKERSNRLVRGRLVAFVLAMLFFLVAELMAESTSFAVASPMFIGTIVAGVLALLGFVALVRGHSRARDEERHLAALVALNEEALARLARDWSALPWTDTAGSFGAAPSTADASSSLEAHPYALDLDIVGPASLERLLNTVSTGPGARTLRSWLLCSARPDDPRDGARDGPRDGPGERAANTDAVAARQEAVVELGGDVDFRQELAALVRTAGLHRCDRAEPLLAWAEESSWLNERQWLVWAARLVPPATFLLLILDLTGVVAGAWWLIGVLLGLVYLSTTSDSTGKILDRISGGHRTVAAYGRALGFLEEMPTRSRKLADLRERIRAGEGSAARALDRLAWWLTVADVRASGISHFILQVLFFWDVHVLSALEGWRRINGSWVGTWLRALGEVEALAALSALRTDHPDWCIPEEIGEPRIAGEEVGHPLLPADACVRNDVEVGPPSTFAFVTGSNMSGKSTFLRAVGVNTVLARAGAPVCAKAFRTARLSVVTSMRTEDSLAEGVSAFMAELQRVAMVVREARGSAAPGPVVLYLLDEPLQGTNAVERRIAIQIVLRQLLECRAIGLVATHDLQLHQTDGLKDAARPVHFEGRVEEVAGEPQLTFDYRLREGLATSTNALDLLRLVGLDSPEPRESQDSA